jgi:hypothetical protein
MEHVGNSPVSAGAPEGDDDAGVMAGAVPRSPLTDDHVTVARRTVQSTGRRTVSADR